MRQSKKEADDEQSPLYAYDSQGEAGDQSDSKKSSPRPKRITVWLKTRALANADWKGSHEGSRASDLSDRKLLFLQENYFSSARGSKVRSELRTGAASEERVQGLLTAGGSAQASFGGFFA